MRWRLVIVCATAACDFTPGSLPTTTDATGLDAAIDVAIGAPPPNLHVRLEAHLDGTSHMILRGTTVQWQHYVYAAPGREVGVNYPTKFDGVDWYPVWPDVPTAENRDCNGCLSSVYMNLPVGVPGAPATATLTPIVWRRVPVVLQQPNASNDYTVVLELSDQGHGGSTWYTVDLDVIVQ